MQPCYPEYQYTIDMPHLLRELARFDSKHVLREQIQKILHILLYFVLWFV